MQALIPLLLLAIFILCALVQLCFLIYYYIRFKKIENYHNFSEQKLPVSVIIAARNEAYNLEENLPLILKQNYPDFEVIVINDCSTDDSASVLESLKLKYGNLKIVTVSEHRRFKTGKKFAVTMGIKAAKNEHLLLTDADCKPASPDWIALMQSKFSADKEIVLGYSPYQKTGGFLNTFVRFETVKTAIGYLAAARAGKPYMGVGRNLAYTKSLFFGAKGFAAHMHLISGDDDLFINQNATKTNTALQIDHDAQTISPAKATLGAYYRQKKRHMGVGKYYKATNRFLITSDALSGFLFYTTLIALLAIKFQLWIILPVYFFRLILQLIVYPRIYKKLGTLDLIWWFPLLDLFYYIYLNVFGLVGSFTKNLRWK